MGLFDIFKKKEPAFEALLKNAAVEPAYRIDLYVRVLSEKFFVLTKEHLFPQDSFITNDDTKAQIRTLDNGSIPIFTSTDRIFDSGVIKTEVYFLELKGDVLFKMLTNKTLIINPYSDYCKEILPAEIEKILDGTILNENVQHLEIKKESKVRIGQPAKYPEAVVKLFTELFSANPNIKAAYLGWIHDPASDIPPHYIFAIEETGNWDTLIKELAFILKTTLDPKEIVDFLKIDGKKGISGYFINSTAPFYKK